MHGKEDNRDDFEKFWENAFQDEQMSPPSGLWEDIESEVDQINQKKNHFTFLKSVAALITVGLLTSFLVKYEAPSSSLAIQADKNTHIEMASMVSKSLLEETQSKEVSVLTKHTLPYIKKVTVNTPPPIIAYKKNKKEDITPVEKENISISNEKMMIENIHMGNSFLASSKKENKKYKVYVGGEIEMVKFDPNIKVNDKVVSESTVAASYGINTGVQFDKGHFVEMGIKYADYAFKSGLSELGEVNQKVVSVPIKIGYAIDKNRIRLALHTALSTNFIVDQTATDNLSDSILDKSVYLTGQLGAELSYKLSQKSSLSLGTTYGISFTDLSNDQQVSAMANSYTVSMGIKYNII